MNIALLAEGTYPFHPGGVSVWCDQLVRGLAPHRFSIHAITAGADPTPTWELPDNVSQLRAIPLWGPCPTVPRKVLSSSDLRAAVEQLAGSLVDPDGDRAFLDALHRLFELSREMPLIGALRSQSTLEVLLGAMRSLVTTDRTGPEGPSPVTVADACTALELVEHQLRPLFAPVPQADLCHAAANGLSVLPALAARWSRGTPFVLSEHGIYLRERYLAYGHEQFRHGVRAVMLRFFKRLTWSGYQEASAIAPGSEYNRYWQVANGADPERIHPVYNGVDADNFIASPAEPPIPTLVWLGRIDPLKDVETLLRAFALVRRELPDARLRIFGGASVENQGYFDRCSSLLDELGLVGHATFEGRADSVVNAYHAGHVVVLSSISEGFPYTLIEAMAAGMPTVATDVGGVREASGDAGLIVPPQDPVRMAEACVRLLGDPALRRTIGHAARSRILSLFTLEQSLAIFGDLYREVTGMITSAPVLERDRNRHAGQVPVTAPRRVSDTPIGGCRSARSLITQGVV